MKYQKPGLAAALFCLLTTACGDPGGEALMPAPYQGPILVWNLSQFELLEIYTHSNGAFSNTGQNQFSEPLAVDATAVITWSEGSYLSVIREKTQGGLLQGLTTQSPPAFNSAYSVLIVFDDGFRALVNESEAEATQGFPGFPTEITEYVPQNEPYPQ